jgi:hypothetical protein
MDMEANHGKTDLAMSVESNLLPSLFIFAPLRLCGEIFSF